MADSRATTADRQPEILVEPQASSASKDGLEPEPSISDVSWFEDMTQRLQDWDRCLNRLRRLCALLESEEEHTRGELWALAASTEQLSKSIRGELDALTPDREKALVMRVQPGGVLRLRKLRRDVERLSREHASVYELMQDLESEVSEWGVETTTAPDTPKSDHSAKRKTETASPALGNGPASKPKTADAAAPVAASSSAKQEAYGTFGTSQEGPPSPALASAVESSAALQQARLDALYAERDLQERQSLLQRLQSGVQQVHAVFRELAFFTESQQQPLDDIEARTRQVLNEQELTALEWERFSRRRRSRRRFCFWFSIWATCVLLFAIYVFLH
jgi:hypothetical protein